MYVHVWYTHVYMWQIWCVCDMCVYVCMCVGCVCICIDTCLWVYVCLGIYVCGTCVCMCLCDMCVGGMHMCGMHMHVYLCGHVFATAHVLRTTSTVGSCLICLESFVICDLAHQASWLMSF